MNLQRLREYHQRQMRREGWEGLRPFCAQLERQGELRRVGASISPRLEITGLCHRSLLAGGPALWFEQPAAGSVPVLGNLFGTRSRVLAALELEDTEGLRELGRVLAFLRQPSLEDGLRSLLETAPEFARLLHLKPEVLRSAAWQGTVNEGPDVDLGVLPVCTCWPEDAGPLVTWGMVITRGPRQQRINLAIYRLQVIDRNRVIMRWLPHRGGAQDFREFQRAKPGQPYPVAVAIGADPLTLLAAVTPIPDSLSEYQFAGLLRGRRSKVVESPLSGLPVPASAEIVLEGWIHPGDTAPEGPFADHTGYYNAVADFPVLTVERIHRRSDSVYLTTYMGRPGEDEPSVMAAALNEVFIPLLQAQYPEVVDFYLPPEACSYRVAIVSICKQYPGHARRIMFAIWSWLRQFTYTKTVIVVDDDIDARDWKSVIWAISTRADPARDTLLVENTPIDYLDFASPVAGLGGKMGIDATNKLPGETDRTWGRPVKPSEELNARIEELVREIGL